MLKTTRTLVPAALLMMSLLCGSAALANGNVTIQDQAGVLSADDKQSITQAARSLTYAVVVWTVSGGFAGNKPGFRNQLDQYVGSNTVGVGVDTADRFSEVAARQNTGLSQADTQAAKASANSHFASKDWGGGVVAAISSLAQASPNRSSRRAMAPGGYAMAPGGYAASYGAPQGYYQGGQSSGGGGFGSIIMLVVVIGILVMLARRFMGGGMNRGGFSPYGPGQYGPGYSPGGYGPGYNAGGGGNGLLAGGLGAVGGGLLGYELGKSAGEREGGQFNQQGGQDWGGQAGSNDPGGIINSDSGSDSSPDFGGGMDSGGADFGGGGDVGGGSTDF